MKVYKAGVKTALTVLLIFLTIPGQSVALNSGDNHKISSTTGEYNNTKEKILAEKDRTAMKKKKQPREWLEFKSKHGNKTWHVYWNKYTGTPESAYGSADLGIGNITSKSEAKDVAWKFLSDNKELLKATLSELELAKIEPKTDAWSLSYSQYYNGTRVYGGGAGITLSKGGKVLIFGSSFYPNINLSTTPTTSENESIEIAKEEAMNLGLSVDNRTQVVETSLLIFPKVKDNATDYYLTWKVSLHSRFEWGYVFFVDAHTGEIVKSYSTAEYGTMRISGAVTGSYKEQTSSDPSQAYDLKDLYVNIMDDDTWPNPDDLMALNITDSSGYYDTGWISNDGGGDDGVDPLADVYVYSNLSSPHVQVYIRDDYRYGDGYKEIEHRYDYGHLESWVIHYWDGNEWNAGGNPLSSGDAIRAMNAYYHVTNVSDFFSSPPFNYGNLPQPLLLEIDSETSSSYSQVDTDELVLAEGISPDSGENLNHALYSDIIYHEYTHHVIYRIYGKKMGKCFLEVDEGGKLNEGIADYYAASMTGDPTIAVGKDALGDNARNLNNNLKLSDKDGTCHHDSQIISGAMWDMRQSIGTNIADKRIFDAMDYPAELQKPDTFKKFFSSLLEVDDLPSNGGNSDLSDSTPHATEIWKAFYDHGMDYDAVVTLSDDSPIEAKLNATTDGNDIFRLDTPGSKFAAVGIKPPAGNDFDMFLYSDPGLSSEVERSLRYNDVVDFVILDDSEASGDYYAWILNVDTSEGRYNIEMEDNPTGLTLGQQSGSFSSDEVLDLYHIYLAAGLEYTFRSEPGVGGDIGIYLYGSTGGDGDELKNSTSGSDGVIESFTYTPSSSGEYAFVVTNENGNNYDYSVIVTSSCVDTAGPNTPSITSPSNGATITSETYTVNWGDVTDNGCADMKGYEVKETKSGGSTKTYPTGLTSELDFSKSPSKNGDYTYWVRGVDNFDNPGSWSPAVSITLDIPEPPPPQEPTLPFGEISDFTDGGPDFQRVYEGTWGVWTYHDWEPGGGGSESDDSIETWTTSCDLATPEHCQYDVAKFRWNNVDASTDDVWIEKTGQWDFSYPTQGEFTLMVYNGGREKESFILNLSDSSGKNAWEWFDSDVPAFSNWVKIKLGKDLNWNIDTGFDWSNVTKVKLKIYSTVTGYTRNLRIDDLKYNMDTYMKEQNDKYIVQNVGRKKRKERYHRREILNSTEN